MAFYRALKRFSSGEYSTPLQIRGTFKRLRKCPQRKKHIRKLLWPFPWHFEPMEPVAGVVHVDPSEQLIVERQSSIRTLHRIPIFRVRDTPLCSLYRMVEDVCTRQDELLGYEAHYLFRHTERRWRLCNIPDPRERDPVVYAILASIVEALVEAFNWKLKLGIRRNGRNDFSEQRAINCELESVPAWAALVAPCEKAVDLLTRPDGLSGGAPEPSFRDRNIAACVARFWDV
ncbi:hypothetical protein M436DRAFT_44116 [Aureobasidium namibiae CBS 147.97]|uniref:Uncharacterized protein n=1 Tax=Aureobasidium namibiae CBS 147.97 TaxID=1043004 RepID=A0A074XHZ4_9PEZI|nr:uncharacterized protein M436DRAFT_44116 [Aureobasidium namibiae CBS 147.97]KEQ74196.1 hypothetical protein M436DRAFT_44116 [Aureobasidium namibiae CBS 147.97]